MVQFLTSNLKNWKIALRDWVDGNNSTINWNVDRTEIRVRALFQIAIQRTDVVLCIAARCRETT